jgi:ER membrane protein SH3
MAPPLPYTYSPCCPVRSLPHTAFPARSPTTHTSTPLPVTGIFTNYVVLPPDLPDAKFPPDLRTPTLGLASSHLVCSVALTGVLALQMGRWWAERADDDAGTAETLSLSGRGGCDKEGDKPESKITAPVEVQRDQ